MGGGGGFHLLGTLGEIGKKAPEMEYLSLSLSLSLRRSVRGTWRRVLDLGSRRICKECFGDGHLSLYEGSVMKPGRGSFTRDLCVQEDFGDQYFSPYWPRCVARVVLLPGNLRDYWNALEMERLSLWELW